MLACIFLPPHNLPSASSTIFYVSLRVVNWTNVTPLLLLLPLSIAMNTSVILPVLQTIASSSDLENCRGRLETKTQKDFSLIFLISKGRGSLEVPTDPIKFSCNSPTFCRKVKIHMQISCLDKVKNQQPTSMSFVKILLHNRKIDGKTGAQKIRLLLLNFWNCSNAPWTRMLMSNPTCQESVIRWFGAPL